MNNAANIKQLVSEQYRDSSNLNARSRLHELYSTNPRGWFQWYFDHLDLPPGSRVLELGCGPGGLWRAVRDRLPASWQITLTDFSQGMVREAHQHLAGSAGQFRFAAADAQSIPFPSGSFDAVIANHMLYHVPDRARAIAGMRRVLRPGGRLFAATNGARHMAQIRELETRFAPEFNMLDEMKQAGFWTRIFSLENGAEQLAASFQEVRVERYPDSLRVTEAQPLVDYILSMLSNFRAQIPAERIQEFTRQVEQEIRATGPIEITKSSGVLIAR